MRDSASWQLRWLNAVLRHVVQPHLLRTKTPQQARRDFERAAGLFRRPPFVLHLPDGATPHHHWVSVGAPHPDWVVLYFHGGAYFAGSLRTHLGLIARLSKLTGLRVLAPDYRLAPEHPAPAAFEDARIAHAALILKGYAPQRIVLGGDSAGGGLALALLADLCARDLRPAGLFAFSPWTDLALTGESLTANAAADPLLPVARFAEAVGYVHGALQATDPRLSPLYADFAAPPPVWFQVGTTEILRDDTLRMANRLLHAGGAATVTQWPGAPHVWQMFDGYIPEARAALAEAARFVRGLIPSPPPQSGN